MSQIVRQAENLDSFERSLGWRFSDRARLKTALTHASAASPARMDNERLEFLGDRVLGLLTAEALLTRFPQEAEGALAPRLNELVRKESLATIAEEIGLGAHLRLGRSEAMTGGRKKAALLADALEAVMAATYLDGGLEAARAVFDKHWLGRLETLSAAPVDAKTELQEWAQARGLRPPSYTLVKREGPDHAPRFTVAASLETGESAAGAGSAKRAAEQEAAAALLARLQGDAAEEGA